MGGIIRTRYGRAANEGFAAIEEPINSPPRYFAAGRLLDAQDRPLTGARYARPEFRGDHLQPRVQFLLVFLSRLFLIPTGTSFKTTGLDGKFVFEPTFEPCNLMVAAPAGWAEAGCEGANENLMLRLKPWAVVKGTLVTTNGTPAAGIVLSLVWWQESSAGVRFFWELSRVTTGAAGQFEFQDVPPRMLELQRAVVMPPMGWRPGVHQAWVTPKPGVTNDLGRVICDPPPTLMETFKRKLGL